MKRQIETEVVRLSSSGFEPTRIERRPGKFRLLVVTTGALGEVTQVLENESKAVIRTKNLPKAPRQRWVEDQTLLPGSHTLRVNERPDFALRRL